MKCLRKQSPALNKSLLPHSTCWIFSSFSSVLYYIGQAFSWIFSFLQAFSLKLTLLIWKFMFKVQIFILAQRTLLRKISRARKACCQYFGGMTQNEGESKQVETGNYVWGERAVKACMVNTISFRIMSSFHPPPFTLSNLLPPCTLADSCLTVFIITLPQTCDSTLESQHLHHLVS